VKKQLRNANPVQLFSTAQKKGNCDLPLLQCKGQPSMMCATVVIAALRYLSLTTHDASNLKPSALVALEGE
jgi:hypothetical protein